MAGGLIPVQSVGTTIPGVVNPIQTQLNGTVGTVSSTVNTATSAVDDLASGLTMVNSLKTTVIIVFSVIAGLILLICCVAPCCLCNVLICIWVLTNLCRKWNENRQGISMNKV